MNDQRTKWRGIFVGFISVALGLAGCPKMTAIPYDLSVNPTVSVDTIYGKAWFTTQFTKTAGTGALNPFLSIQADGTEQGFNVDSGDLDTKRNPQYTKTQRVADLQAVTVGGMQYYAFLIDANESGGSKDPLSLDSLKIYTSGGSQSALTSLAALDSLGTLRFDLGGNASILYSDVNSGSGQGDLGIFIPVSALLGVSLDDYFYMYQQFSQSDGGYEETREAGDITFVPVPETSVLPPMLAMLAVIFAGPYIRRYFDR
jgi:hypothetical protein